jgi:hypothetical protein
MYVRITKFTDCDPERVRETVSRVEELDGPPEGVPSSGVKVVVSEDERTLIFIGFFETAEDLRTGDQVLRDMDPPGGVPGTNAGVDMGEIRVEKSTG